MKKLLNTLYAVTPGLYLKLDHDTVRIENENGKIMQIPLNALKGIVVQEGTAISPALVAYCIAEGKEVVFLDRNGQFQYRAVGRVKGNVLLRLSQFDCYKNPVLAAKLARAFVAGKIQNMRSLLLRAARETDNQIDCHALKNASNFIGSILRDLKNEEAINNIRGIEGQATLAYFNVFTHMVKADREFFRFKARYRRPPRDAINALLSYIYTLLAVDCNSALEGVGLDPQIGFLHSVRPGRLSLAFDLMEEFRSVIGDRMAVAMINRRQLDEDDFEMRPGGAVYLNDKGRKKVIQEFQKRKQEEVIHPLLKETVPFGILPHVQARLLAKVIRQELPEYLPFFIK